MGKTLMRANHALPSTTNPSGEEFLPVLIVLNFASVNIVIVRDIHFARSNSFAVKLSHCIFQVSNPIGVVVALLALLPMAKDRSSPSRTSRVCRRKGMMPFPLCHF